MTTPKRKRHCTHENHMQVLPVQWCRPGFVLFELNGDSERSVIQLDGNPLNLEGLLQGWNDIACKNGEQIRVFISPEDYERVKHRLV